MNLNTKKTSPVFIVLRFKIKYNIIPFFFTNRTIIVSFRFLDTYFFIWEDKMLSNKYVKGGL